MSTTIHLEKCNIIDELGRIKSNATLLDMARKPKHIENLKRFLERQAKQKTPTSYITITELDEEEPEHVGTVSTFKRPKNPPFYVSIKTMDEIAHCYLIHYDYGPNMMSKTIMEELGLY